MRVFNGLPGAISRFVRHPRSADRPSCGQHHRLVPAHRGHCRRLGGPCFRVRGARHQAFCILEALQNVAKYAQALMTTVTLNQVADRLEFSVADDGAGFNPAAAAHGTGLHGMADRLSAVGGQLGMASAPGRGIASRPATAPSPANCCARAEQAPCDIPAGPLHHTRQRRSLHSRLRYYVMQDNPTPACRRSAPSLIFSLIHRRTPSSATVRARASTQVTDGGEPR